jgi:hypothetical protein
MTEEEKQAFIRDANDWMTGWGYSPRFAAIRDAVAKACPDYVNPEGEHLRAHREKCITCAMAIVTWRMSQ